LQPRHPGHKVGIGRFQHPMIMVAYQTESMHLPTWSSGRLRPAYSRNHDGPHHPQNVIPLVAPAHHMIHRHGIFNAFLSWHGSALRHEIISVNPRMNLATGDPFELLCIVVIADMLWQICLS
jgi:hypothetical protein